MAVLLRLIGCGLLLTTLVSPIAALWARDNHDAPPVAAPVQLLPRGHARADGIEAVAVAAPGRRLVIYLDRLDTNEPVAGATVEADADSIKLELRDAGDGTYLGQNWTANPGPNLIMLTYRVAGAERQIEITLNAPQAAGPSQAQLAAASLRIEQASTGTVAAMAIAVYLLAMGLFTWRARQSTRRAA